MKPVQKLFNQIELKLRHNIHHNYKESLKAQINIDSTAFEVLYYDELEDYVENPRDYHIYEDGYINWSEVLEQLKQLNTILN